MGEKICSYFFHYFLSRTDHQLIIAKSGKGPAGIHSSHTGHCQEKALLVSRQNELIDHRLQEIGPHNISSCADQHQKGHQHKHPLMHPQIFHKMQNGFFRIFRSFISHISCHYSSAPSFCES